jgi:hypothetical protein
MTTRQALLAALGCAALAGATRADRLSLAPTQDNTLYSVNGSTSNGSGEYLFCGANAIGPTFRRALLDFDVAGSVPAGSTVVAATLTLNMSMTIAGDETCSLHRLSASWGEGASDATGQEGQGAPAVAPDATWTDRFFGGSTWTSAGGDFVGGPSASTVVGVSTGSYSWSSAQLVADVQDMLDTPGGDHGWILIGNESTGVTAKRFDSRENATPANRPALVVDFIPPGITFCNATDGALASCPCSNPGLPLTGCDIAQGTGGVLANLIGQTTGPNSATLQGTGFPPAAAPSAIVIRANNLEASPVVFGDGLRCVGLTGFARLAATAAAGGVSTHVFGHGAAAGTYFYQIWFRNTPVSYCVTTGASSGAFNLSNGYRLTW